MPISEVYNMDCVGYMKTLPDNYQIIWGANNFGIPFKGFIAWDKMVRGSDRYSQVEIASISDGLGTVSRYVRVSCAGKNKIHPTQKPVALYNWILDTYGGGVK